MIEMKCEKDYRDAHRKMWQWLSENPEKTKAAWVLRNKDEYLRVTCDCFACAFAEELSGTKCDLCSVCPISWAPHIDGATDMCWASGNENRLDPAYYLWVEAEKTNDLPLRKKLASQIRDMWPEPKVRVKFEGVDYWGTLTFASLLGKDRYGFIGLYPDIPSDPDEKTKFLKYMVENRRDEMLYLGNSFECEPMGTRFPEEVILY